MAETRTAILEAVAAEIAEAGLTDFSIQGVADRAGVTHRTVYNYFPTREALNDAFAEHVEALSAGQKIANAEVGVGVGGLPRIAKHMHTAVGDAAAPLQAYVMMTIATATAARVFRDRSKKIEQRVDEELGPFEPGIAKLVTSAVRMFLSSSGWFLLKKHHGLSREEAGRVSEWAVRVLLDAVRKGDVPKRLDEREKNDA
jgi:AcrR family transcriptional regulator